ncbi:hypothetical protein EGR_02868 [Echinococcus granulosus]|uniref:Uncharacterized protein n=1 Tax=Echinococcus granulosus TaxID=6210 RepID=W6ULJ9_ECHGR|nr:hypothetical protein EGR_02868 [Echinococcus granulosus]EUB62415.1 hypothetical protein EGR_02868 [Echinococcus granulosus]
MTKLSLRYEAPEVKNVGEEIFFCLIRLHRLSGEAKKYCSGSSSLKLGKEIVMPSSCFIRRLIHLKKFCLIKQFAEVDFDSQTCVRLSSLLLLCTKLTNHTTDTMLKLGITKYKGGMSYWTILMIAVITPLFSILLPETKFPPCVNIELYVIHPSPTF